MIEKLKQLEKEIKNVNHELIREKRKTYKKRLQIRKKKLLKEYKQFKKFLLELAKMRKLDIWLIDLTAISVKTLKTKKQRYFKDSEKYYNDKNLLVAYNFKHGYGYAIETEYTQITKRDLQKLLNLLPNNAEVITDNRHKYVQTLNKSFTMQIERLFGWIKKPIYKQLKTNKITTIEQLINLYKKELQKWNIIPYGF